MALADELVTNGFVAIRGAVARETIDACCAVLESELLARGVDPHDPSSWTQPVVRFACPDGPAFAAAGTSPALHAAYDELLGPGRWVRREGVGGSVPVRFPSTDDPGDAGWHIDASYEVDGEWRVNVHSRHRGLLALFLFTDVTDDDAPTEILVGSHLDVPPILAPLGEAGVSNEYVIPRLPSASFDRPRAFATGRAGDVYLCHPFLVHRATWPHRGIGPRMIAQPEVAHNPPFALVDRPDVCAVERAILRGLAQSGGQIAAS